MNLDAVTLIWIHVALTALTGVALVSIPLFRPGTRLVRGFGMAMLALCIGNAGIALRDRMPEAASILLSNGLILLAGLLAYQTVSRFVLRDRTRPDIAGWLVAAFTLGWLAWFSVARPDMVARLTVFLPVAAFFIARIAWLFGVFSRSDRGSPVSDVLTGLLWFFSFIVLLTGMLTTAGVNPVLEWCEPGPAGMTYLATRIALLLVIASLVTTIDLRTSRGARRSRKSPAASRKTAAPKAVAAATGQIAAAAARALARADPKRRPLSVVVIEIDNFKHVAGEHGPDAAQALLDWAGERIQWALRPDDVLERIGTDDFAILMPETDPQQAIGRADQMRDAIAHGVCRVRDLALRTSASAGVAGFAPGRASWDELLRAARAGMTRTRDESRSRRDSLAHPVGGMRYRARA